VAAALGAATGNVLPSAQARQSNARCP
jgi:hypothetical protein